MYCVVFILQKRKKQALLKRAKSIEQDLSVVAASGATGLSPSTQGRCLLLLRGGSFGEIQNSMTWESSCFSLFSPQSMVHYHCILPPTRRSVYCDLHVYVCVCVYIIIMLIVSVLSRMFM